MRQRILEILLLFTIPIINYSQPCLPNGIVFTNQNQIDYFKINYPNCTEIIGLVYIIGADIANLDSLNQITSIGTDLHIKFNPSLTNINGLYNLQNIGNGVLINDNPLLVNLSGLNSLINVGGYLEIQSNQSLINLFGLDSLTSIGADLKIFGNNSLTNLNGLNALESVGWYMIIGCNSLLNNLIGLNNLDSIGEWFQLLGNSSVYDLVGLENLSYLGGSLEIENNQSLHNFNGLNSLANIGGDLKISQNSSLGNLHHLINLTSIGGSIWIEGNDVLPGLFGLDNIDKNSIENLWIIDNNMLSKCAIQSVCEYLKSPTGNLVIENNEEGCNSVVEVENECEMLEVNKFNKAKFSVHPNPSDSKITITIFNGDKLGYINIYNYHGQRIKHIENQKKEIDISPLNPGLYVIEISINNQLEHKLFLKH